MSAAEDLTELPHLLVRSKHRPDRIGPGTYLVELVLGKPIGQRDFFEGLRLIGFSRVLVVRAGKKGMNPVFVARLHRAIRLVDTPLIRWQYIDAVEIDLFSAVPPLDACTEPYELEMGATYEMRFVTRVKKTPKLADVEDALREMGFGPNVDITRLDTADEKMLVHVTADKTNMQLSVWYARGRWRLSKSVVTQEDPFVFLEMRAVR